MIDLSAVQRQEVEKILQAVVPNTEVWAFGSRVSNTAKPYSDLDLAFITAQPLTLAQMADIRSAFEDSDLNIRVDVVYWALTSEEFRSIIAENKVLIQRAS